MQFVDEVSIYVAAGSGGRGCLSFHREKFVPMGGPDGGDGGKGGDVYLQAAPDLNTLVDFRHNTRFEARNGDYGKGRQRSGRCADDLFIPVPIGTTVFDEQTEECLGDILEPGQVLLVARGGKGGLGNVHFKSSTNRSPRKTIPARDGETRYLRLELKLLADVGLLGLPNAGKSSLIRAISAATPKVADYPFTTLHPHLGVVRVDELISFVMADIPGLIEGAAAGAGLGLQFLRHLSRTRLLLHVVDVLPVSGNDPVEDAEVIRREVADFSEALADKPTWFVLNKADLLPPEQQAEKINAFKLAFNTEQVFLISTLTKQGTQALCYAIADYLKTPCDDVVAADY